MKTLTSLLAILFMSVCHADELKTAAGSSPGYGGITSYGNARAGDFAGIKTKIAVAPRIGFGNTISATDGSCSFNPALNWVYTKKVETISWTTNYGDFFHSPSVADQQATLLSGPPNGWSGTFVPYDGTNLYPCEEYISDGHGGSNFYIGTFVFDEPVNCGGGIYQSSKCIYDASDDTIFPSNPAGGTASGSGSRTDQYYQYFAVSSPYVTPASSTSGSLPSIPEQVDPFNFWGTWHNETNDFLNATFENYFNISTNLSSAVWTKSSAGQWQGVVAYETYPWIHTCAGSGSGNYVFGTRAMTYTNTITYSDPVDIDDMAAMTEGMLTNINLHSKGERYYCFDRTNYPVQLTWNPIYWSNSVQLRTYIWRTENTPTWSVTRLASIVKAAPFTTLETNWPVYYDTTAEEGKLYYYKLHIEHVASGGAFFLVWEATNTISTTNTGPIFPALPLTVRTMQLTNTITNQPLALNFQITNLWHQLSFAPSMASFISKASTNNPNESIVLFPTSADGSTFVLTTNVQCGKPFFLAAYGEPVGSNQVSFPSVSGTPNMWYSASSLGYLPMDNPSNTPLTSNWLAKFYFTNYNRTVGGEFSLYWTNFSNFNFVRFKLATTNAPWMMSRWYDFNALDCPERGYLIYR